MGFPGGSVGKESACNAGDVGSNPGPGRAPGEKHGHSFCSTPVFLPGESHGLRSLAGYSPQDRKESDITEATEHALILIVNKPS